MAAMLSLAPCCGHPGREVDSLRWPDVRLPPARLQVRRPPVIHEPSDAWPGIAAGLLAGLRAALAPIDRSGSFRYDHIGSTSVPGLAAKPIVDLQVQMPALPSIGELEGLLGPSGYRAATGARPDSPGVFRDLPRGSEPV